LLDAKPLKKLLRQYDCDAYIDKEKPKKLKAYVSNLTAFISW